MSFVGMNNADLEAVRKHHDMLIEMGALELRADKIRQTCPANLQDQMLQPIESKMHVLGDALTHMAA